MDGIDGTPNNVEQLRALLLEAQDLNCQKSREIKQLQNELANQLRIIGLKNEQISRLDEAINQLLSQKFSSSSERWEGQDLLFNEAESSAAPKPPADEYEEVKAHKRKKRGRKPLPENLPRVETVYELVEEDRNCSCGTKMREVGETVTEQLDVIPAKVRVIKHVRKKYVCPCCEGQFKTAPMPKQPIPGSIASAGLLAHVTVGKYCDGMPLYRQEEILRRIGVDIPRATLANWMIQLAALVMPLINLIKDHILAASTIVMDETNVQVLKEKGRKAQTKSFMWVMVRAGPGPKAILFEYSPTRSAEVARELLSGFNGSLVTDGYAGYSSVAESLNIMHAGCWSHARRKFHDAVKAGSGDGKSIADEGLMWIQCLFNIDRRHKSEEPNESLKHRRLYSRSVVDHIRKWLDRNINRVTPKSKTGKALHYMNNQWHELTRFLEDGNIPLSNAAAENAIRPFVVGRKAWLFANSVKGAEASAALYSLIETAKANQIEPYSFLKTVFTELPNMTSLEEIERLLPWNIET